MSPKNILVITASSPDGLKIKKFLKPVSAHIVAGTNLFTDLFASFSDIFGGRSNTYQNQISSLYNDAIERIKYAAFEIGANCIIGLQIDLDEISGKGKSMFMLTAVGTAVILDIEESIDDNNNINTRKLENITNERINFLIRKKEIITKANDNNLVLDEELWAFITANQLEEIYPYLIKKFIEPLAYEQTSAENANKFYSYLLNYIDALPDVTKTELLYNSIANELNESLVLKLCAIINDLHLLDLAKCYELLKNESFEVRKRGLRIMTYSKSFYNKQDLHDMSIISEFIKKTFPERGVRSTKKQLLSSKEKEVWSCECGKSNNEIDTYCTGCFKDIYGFKTNDVHSITVSKRLSQKIEIISENIA